MKIGFSALFVFALPIAVSVGWHGELGAVDRNPEKGGSPLYVNGFEAPGTVPCALVYPVVFQATWMETYHSAWPGYNTVLVAYPPYDGAYSLAFSPPAIPDQYGTVITAAFTGDGAGLAHLSISSTPGCFDPAQLQSNCLSAIGNTPELDWSYSGIPGRCRLTPGQTYYVNLTFGGEPIDGMPGCPFGGCATELRNVRR